MLLSHAQRSLLSTLFAIGGLVALIVFLGVIMNEQADTPLDVFQSKVAQARTQAAADAQLPIETFTAGSYLDVSPEDALRRNIALPIDPWPNPPAPMFNAGWLGTQLDASRDCLTRAVYYEANGEPLAGQRAVAQVVLNRLRNPRFPKSICEVVYQGAGRRTGCQFTFTCDGSLARSPNPRALMVATAVAVAALNGSVSREAGQATHYHNLSVFPLWATELRKVAVIGHHVFYQPHGATYDYAAFRAQAAKVSTGSLVETIPTNLNGDAALSNPVLPAKAPPLPPSATVPSPAPVASDIPPPIEPEPSKPVPPEPSENYPPVRRARAPMPMSSER